MPQTGLTCIKLVELSVRDWMFKLGQCSQPSNPSVFVSGRDGLPLIVRLFGGARTEYTREGEDRTDYRGL